MITHPSSSDCVTPLSPHRQSLLKYQRLLRGWSQRDVANELHKLCSANGYPNAGINLQQVCRWETGWCKPGPFYRKHLCQLYGLNAAQLGFIEPQGEQG